MYTLISHTISMIIEINYDNDDVYARDAHIVLISLLEDMLRLVSFRFYPQQKLTFIYKFSLRS